MVDFRLLLKFSKNVGSKLTLSVIFMSQLVIIREQYEKALARLQVLQLPFSKWCVIRLFSVLNLR